MKTPKYRRIISNKYYTPEKLARRVQVTVTTIYSHIKEGLPADKTIKPSSIYGRDAKDYYIDKYPRKKNQHGTDEFRCSCCGLVFVFLNYPVKIIATSKVYSPGKIQVPISGMCPRCNRVYSRFKSMLSSNEIDACTPIHIDTYVRGGKK